MRGCKQQLDGGVTGTTWSEVLRVTTASYGSVEALEKQAVYDQEGAFDFTFRVREVLGTEYFLRALALCSGSPPSFASSLCPTSGSISANFLCGLEYVHAINATRSIGGRALIQGVWTLDVAAQGVNMLLRK